MNFKITIAFFFLTSWSVWAACPGSPPSGIQCVDYSTTKSITAHSQCRRVTNNHASTKDLMVPVGSAGDWSSFYNNAPAGVTAAACTATYVGTYPSAWSSTADKVTGNFNVLTGDVLVVFLIAENEGGSFNNPVGGSLTWTARQTIDLPGYTETRAWTAVVDADKTMNVGISKTGAGLQYGIAVMHFRNSSGIGASGKANASGFAPSVTFSTTGNNSAIAFMIGDWLAADGSGRTYRTGAGTPNEVIFYNSAQYGVYGAYHPNAGASGSKTVGFTAPTLSYAIIAVEVLGP